jgi:hypothetical protein
MSSQHFKSWVALYLNTDLIPKAEKHQMGMKLKSAWVLTGKVPGWPEQKVKDSIFLLGGRKQQRQLLPLLVEVYLTGW